MQIFQNTADAATGIKFEANNWICKEEDQQVTKIQNIFKKRSV